MQPLINGKTKCILSQTWVFDGDKNHTVTPLNAIKKLVGDKVQVIYEPGLTYSREKNPAGISKAVSAASRADVILAFVGEEAILSGEAHSLADLNLQGDQGALISALAKTGKPVVTVVMAGRPLTIGKEVEESAAVLYSFHPGTMGGPALADLLWGKAVPSGKTPITFPKAVGQIPIYYAHNNTGRPANHERQTILQQRLSSSDLYLKFYQMAKSHQKASNDDFRQLAELIDEVYDNFTHRLIELYPFINEKEMRICLLIKIGLAPTQISDIVCSSNSGISMIRQRLYMKIFQLKGKPDEFDKKIMDL